MNKSDTESPRIRRRPPIHKNSSKQQKERIEVSENEYSEDEDDKSSIDEDENYNLSSSKSDTSFERSRNFVFECANHNRPTPLKRTLVDNKSNNNNITWTGVCAVITVLIGAFFALALSFLAQETTLQNKLTVAKIHKKFPSQPNDTLEAIEAVIDDVLAVEPIHPAVFLFLYDKNTENDVFVSTIANFACDKLNITPNPIIIDEATYNSPEVKKEFGYLIDHYRPLLESQRVMIIKNLHKMPSETAKALHTFCDDITPLVERAVYILTLQVDKYDGSEQHTAEKVLNHIWSDLKSDIRAPLLTRVINTVIKIY